MTYANQGLLRDANGIPIPQFYDPIADEFKPLNDPKQYETQQPVRVEGRNHINVKTHNAVSVATVTYSYGAWTKCEGFDSLVASSRNDAETTSQLIVDWSFDGVNVFHTEFLSNTSRSKHLDLSTKAPYVRVGIYNGDTVAHTFTAHAYLKA